MTQGCNLREVTSEMSFHLSFLKIRKYGNKEKISSQFYQQNEINIAVAIDDII